MTHLWDYGCCTACGGLGGYGGEPCVECYATGHTHLDDTECAITTQQVVEVWPFGPGNEPHQIMVLNGDRLHGPFRALTGYYCPSDSTWARRPVLHADIADGDSKAVFEAFIRTSDNSAINGHGAITERRVP